MGYQNGSDFTKRAVHGVKAQKNGFTGKVEPCQTGPYYISSLRYAGPTALPPHMDVAHYRDVTRAASSPAPL